MPWQGNGWSPTTVTRFVRSLATSTGVAIVDTDCGEGFLKAIGNPEGPHVLACELAGSLLADWIGLPTLDFAIVAITEDDEIPIGKGGIAGAGPAFITRRVQGFAWGGDIETLRSIANTEDITRLILLDTWIRNCDRHRPVPPRNNKDNVFFVQPASTHLRRPVLTAIDHTHAFTCSRELTRSIDTVRDPISYGEFPAVRSIPQPGRRGRRPQPVGNDDVATCRGIHRPRPVGVAGRCGSSRGLGGLHRATGTSPRRPIRSP